MTTTPERPRITLALSSGISLTMAHIGVLQALEEANIPVDGIAGSSGGGLVGALYAAGLSISDMADAARGLRWRDLVDFRVPRMGFLTNEKLEKFLRTLIGDVTFDELPMPLAIICCNLTSGHEEIIREGLVARAVRATCSIPQVFAPVDHNGRLLCDGGILNKVPVVAARDLGADFVLCCDVGMHTRRNRVPTNIFEVTSKVMSLVAEDRAERERRTADVLVAPNLFGFNGAEMGHTDEVIAVGRAAMEEQLPALRALIDAWHEQFTWRGRLRAWWRGAA